MKVGILTDGKYGERAYENICKVFPCDWIQVDEIPTSVILDEYQLDIPDCDLFISYLRHPDQVFALAELGKPTLLGISFGPGFLNQVKRINPKVFAFPTMCSLEPDTGVAEIDEFARYFGRPVYKTDFVREKVQEIEVIRTAPCGSSKVGAQYIRGKEITSTELQDFAIHVCHECRAPKFGRTCDKEISGIIHIRALIASFPMEQLETMDPVVLNFIEQIETEYIVRLQTRGAA